MGTALTYPPTPALPADASTGPRHSQHARLDHSAGSWPWLIVTSVTGVSLLIARRAFHHDGQHRAVQPQGADLRIQRLQVDGRDLGAARYS